jgi:chemotaxis receptor (MCP) glutamine deamidase CheD
MTNEPQNQLMSDYESALSAAVSVLISAVVELGAEPETLVARLGAHHEEFKLSGNKNAAATIEDLVAYTKSLADNSEPARSRAPKASPRSRGGATRGGDRRGLRA